MPCELACGEGGSIAGPAAAPAARASEGPRPAEREAPRIPYRLVATYAHDPAAFTQGLLVHRGRLLESTGQLGQSSLREVEIETGRVLRSVPLAGSEFGEGLALAGERLFQLTWRNERALVWNASSLARVGELPYTGEGWGLTFDGRELVQSDGSSLLVFRSPQTFAATRSLSVTRAGRPQFYLNELEWIEGAIWANVWMSDEIVRIDPVSGEVTGVLDAAGLLTPEESRRAEVLNGIAWDAERKLLYVTGKWWPKLFALSLEP